MLDLPREEKQKDELTVLCTSQVKEYIARAEELKLQLKPHKHEGTVVDGVIQRSDSTDSRTELCKYMKKILTYVLKP